jgi:hypothetical protein
LTNETIVKKNRKVVVKDSKTSPRTFKGKDSTALYYDSTISGSTFYVDSLMYKHSQYNNEHILTHSYKIKRYISCYEKRSSYSVMVVYQFGKLLEYDNKGQKISKSVCRLGWVKDIEYKNGKKGQVKRYRVKKLCKGIE